MRNRLFAVLLAFALLTMPECVAFAESGGVEYAFDSFSIELPETYLVITKGNYQDETLDLGIYEDLLGDYRDSFKQDTSLHLVAFDPKTAVLLFIELPRLRSWNDLSVAGKDEIQNEIMPEYLESLADEGFSVRNSGFETIGSLGYLYAQAAYSESKSLYRYYTMIQTMDGLFGVVITAVDLGGDGPDKGADVAREAARGMDYIGTEGNDVSLLTEDYRISFRLPSYWMKLYDKSSNPDDVWWGEVGGDEIMLLAHDGDIWTFFTDKEKELFGYRTRRDMVLTEDGEMGKVFLQKYFGGGMPDYEYLWINGVCFLKFIFPSSTDNSTMYMTISDAVRYDFLFWMDGTGPEVEAEIESIMQTVAFAPRGAAQ